MLKVGAQLHKEARPPKSTGFGCGHLRTTNMARVESSAGRPDVTTLPSGLRAKKRKCGKVTTCSRDVKIASLGAHRTGRTCAPV